MVALLVQGRTPHGSLTWASRPAAAAAVLALNLASPKSMILNSICGPSGAREPSALTLKPGRSGPAAARALAASSGDRSSHSLRGVCKDRLIKAAAEHTTTCSEGQYEHVELQCEWCAARSAVLMAVQGVQAAIVQVVAALSGNPGDK